MLPINVKDLDIRAIAAVSKTDGGIGLNGRIPWKNTDLAFFREETDNGVVVMGGNTLRADPRLGKLKNRVVHSWSRVGDKRLERDPVLFIQHIMEPYIDWPTKPILWIAGGEETYRTFAPFVKYLSITPIEHDGPCDTFFPFDAYYSTPARQK